MFLTKSYPATLQFILSAEYKEASRVELLAALEALARNCEARSLAAIAVFLIPYTKFVRVRSDMNVSLLSHCPVSPQIEVFVSSSDLKSAERKV